MPAQPAPAGVRTPLTRLIQNTELYIITSCIRLYYVLFDYDANYTIVKGTPADAPAEVRAAAPAPRPAPPPPRGWSGVALAGTAVETACRDTTTYEHNDVQYGQSPYLDSGLQRVWLKQNLNFEGRNSQPHREFSGNVESTNLSRDNLSREIGRSRVGSRLPVPGCLHYRDWCQHYSCRAWQDHGCVGSSGRDYRFYAEYVPPTVVSSAALPRVASTRSARQERTSPPPSELLVTQKYGIVYKW